MTTTCSTRDSDRGPLRHLLLVLSLGWLAAFVYVLMEWLFFATKPSILNYFTTLEKLSALFVGAFLVLLPALPLLLAAWALGWFMRRYVPLRGWVEVLVPGFLLACSALLLADNFSYTVFGFHSGSFVGFGKWAYGLLFVAAWLGLARWLRPWLENGQRPVLALAGLLLLPLVPLAWLSLEGSEVKAGQGGVAGSRPNVLILSSDGVNARNTSAYGYARETTPFIDSLLEDSLVFHNHLSNAANTTGGVSALLTGKLPTTLRVVYPPDALRGNDAYEHLPGILRKWGYRNGDISIRAYADTVDLNFQEGFDFVNGRHYGGRDPFGLLAGLRQRYPAAAQFLSQTVERIAGRLLYLAGLRELENPFEQATAPLSAEGGIDAQRMQQLFAFLEEPGRPFFLHVHLLGTHGPRFRPLDPVFSRGQEQSRDFMTDFYDDAIRDYDRYVSQVVAQLEAAGELENTLLILNTDHGWGSSETHLLPLIMRFPEQAFRGEHITPSQRADIAPTILDYLDIPSPYPMDGRSLLASAGEVEEADIRPIYLTGGRQGEKTEAGHFEVRDLEPPFYTLGRLSMAWCQRMFRLHLEMESIEVLDLAGFVKPCPPESLPGAERAKEMLLGHLADKGYDVSGLDPRIATDHLSLFSGKHPLLRGDYLYLPAVLYRGEVLAAVLERDGDADNDSTFRVLAYGPAVEDAEILEFDVVAGELPLPLLRHHDGTQGARLHLTEVEPPTFILNIDR